VRCRRDEIASPEGAIEIGCNKSDHDFSMAAGGTDDDEQRPSQIWFDCQLEFRVDLEGRLPELLVTASRLKIRPAGVVTSLGYRPRAPIRERRDSGIVSPK
jgi:hypothetical protein